MKARIAICILFLSVVFSACKKSSSSNVTLVKTMLNAPVGGPDVTDTFFYNSQNWVTSIKGSDGSKATFTYSGSIVTEMQYNSGGTLINTYTGYLNPQSLVDSLIHYNNSSSVYTYFKYTYDANGYPTVTTRYGNTNISNSIFTYGIHSGNIDSIVASQPVGGFLQTSTTNAFATDYTNSIGNANMGQPYLGKSSTNVIASSITFSNSNNSTTTTNYTYTYDVTGRIASQATRVGAILTSTQSYTYY